MRTIGRYAILGLLGRGGMGAVYKAAMPRTGRVVAVKVLKPSEMLAATADPALLRRDFFREAALMAGIRHPNIAQVLDVDEAPSAGGSAGLPFFVMEYYCNNLGALLGEGYRVEEPTRRLGVEQALSCARQLASACARLHHAGILHRDVKPFNLMLAERPPDTCQAGPGQADVLLADEVKLIDFGLSRLRGEKGPATPRGAVVGSPYYAAPEQEADPEAADERADVFSASVTLFRCLTGHLPQEGVPASRLRAGLDQRFDAFFARACSADRRKRPGSARDLLAELDALRGHWASLRENVCALPEESLPPCATARPFPALRAASVRQPLAGARAAFGLDELWRPVSCDPERFVVLGQEGLAAIRPEGRVAKGPEGLARAGEGLVRDQHAGLVWEQGGSAYALNFAAAQDRARRLAAERHLGIAGWRLPTVAELATLLLPEPDLRQLCLSPAFAPQLRRIWTADRKSFTAAWYADVEHGFVWWQDLSCEFFVRCCAPF